MIKTYGSTHVALAVKDAKRSFEFYREVFGVEKVYDQGGFSIHLSDGYSTSGNPVTGDLTVH